MACCLLLFASIGFTLPGRAADCLTLWGDEPEKLLLRAPIDAGGWFTLEFINSIYLAPVRETYLYEPAKGITAVKVESPSAGVFEYYGLPTDGTGVASVSVTVKEIRVRSHDYQNHVVTVAGRKIRLKGLVKDSEPMVIRIGTGEACRP